MSSYPETVKEVLHKNTKYKRGVLAVMKRFRKSKAWRGTVEERKAKFVKLHEELCEIYGKSTALEFGDVAHNRGSGNSCYWSMRDKIVLSGRLSVVTYLHEFGHALGKDERGACKWSINLFRRIFPKSYKKLQHVGHMLRKE